MKETAESRFERWKRSYHLRGPGWAREQVVAVLGAGVILLVVIGLNGLTHNTISRLGQSEWWTRQTPQVRYLVEGGLLEGFGLALLRSRLRRRGGFRALSFWDVRMFVGEVAMIAAGLVFLVKAGIA